jgi:hypothetical protein
VSEVSSTLKLEQLARLLALKLPAAWRVPPAPNSHGGRMQGLCLLRGPCHRNWQLLERRTHGSTEHGMEQGAWKHGSMEAMVEALGVGRCTPRKCRTNESPNGIPEIARMPPPMAPSLDRAFLVLSRSSKPIFSLRFHKRGQSCGRIFTNQPLSPVFHGLRLDK